MKTIKHEMFSVEMTNKELEELVNQHIFSKYPHLKDESVWSWEDFDIKFDYKEQDKVAVFSMWAKNTETRIEDTPAKCGGVCSSCSKVDPFNTVCR
jgi:uncharacterized protein YqgQ